MKRRVLAGSVIVACLLPGVAAAAEGKADGQMTLGGKPVKLGYAYAIAKKGFFDEKKDDVLVILSDVPLDAKAVADDFTRVSMAKAGKFHGVEVTIDAGKKPISVTLRHDALKVPQSGGSTEDAFDASAFDAKTIGGRVYRKSPGTTFDDVPFSYDVRFQAAIAPKEK